MKDSKQWVARFAVFIMCAVGITLVMVRVIDSITGGAASPSWTVAVSSVIAYLLTALLIGMATDD